MELLNCRFASRVVGVQWESKLVPYIRKYSMRNKSSIVTSAADGCGKPSSIRSMDNSPSRDHKGADYKESFMLSKCFPIARGSSLTAALAITAFAGLAGTASANIIYQDNFSGASTTPLNGAAPTIDNGTSTTWTAGVGFNEGYWLDNGSTSIPNSTGGAYLSFTPVSGNIYTLTASFKITASTGNWFGLGFVKSPNTSNSLVGSGAYAWGLIGPNGEGQLFTGPDNAGSQPVFQVNPFGTFNILSIVLNTQASAWTWQMSANGTPIDSVVAFATNPNITAVGLGNSVVSAQVSNFELSSAPVPEPATLGLFAIGAAAGLFLLKRRRMA